MLLEGFFYISLLTYNEYNKIRCRRRFFEDKIKHLYDASKMQRVVKTKMLVWLMYDNECTDKSKCMF